MHSSSQLRRDSNKNLSGSLYLRNDGRDVRRGGRAPPKRATRRPAWPCRGLRYAPWLLPPRGALRVRGDRGLSARDALRFRVFLPRDASRPPCGAVPRVRDALLPYYDAPLPSSTWYYLALDG